MEAEEKTCDSSNYKNRNQQNNQCAIFSHRFQNNFNGFTLRLVNILSTVDRYKMCM